MSTLDIQRYLDEKHVDYALTSHPRTYSAQATAEAAHIPGRTLVKTVVVQFDNRPAMVLEPAPSRVELERLKQATGAAEVRLAAESEIATMFPDCELGAMPPFGSFYGMEVFVDEALTQSKQIAFNAGSHTELITLAYDDFARLQKVRVIH